LDHPKQEERKTPKYPLSLLSLFEHPDGHKLPQIQKYTERTVDEMNEEPSEAKDLCWFLHGKVKVKTHGRHE